MCLGISVCLFSGIVLNLALLYLSLFKLSYLFPIIMILMLSLLTIYIGFFTYLGYILQMFIHKLSCSYSQVLRLCRMIVFHSLSICSVENSELLSGLLREWNIPHNVLNARPKVCEIIDCWYLQKHMLSFFFSTT